MTDKVEELWSQEMLAKHLGVSVRTLERQRVAGGGVRYVKVGRLVRYRKGDIDAYLAAGVRSSTSDRGAV